MALLRGLIPALNLLPFDVPCSRSQGPGMDVGLGWGLGCTCVPGEAGALQIPFLGQDCSTGLKLCPEFSEGSLTF